MHRIKLISFASARLLSCRNSHGLGLHAAVDYNALSFKKYNVNNHYMTILTDRIQVGFGPGKLAN